jgi:hypothetical protein
MRKLFIAAALAACVSGLGADIASAGQRCFQRQERVCGTVGRGHDGRPRVACSYRTVRQCFQVPEVRNPTIQRRLRRRR